MTAPADNQPTTDFSDDEAKALDAVIEARHAGQPIDLTAILGRFPQLVQAVNALDQLQNLPQKTGNGPGLAADGPAQTSEVSKGFGALKVGHYQIEAELGSGGFGVVYKAYDSALARHVALKILHSYRVEQADAIERFFQEARATARLRHPGIVQLLEFGRDGPPFFLATEFVEGVDPRSWCRQHQSSIAEKANLIARIAQALDHAHAHGVYHRDLKPANILVDEQGDPHILDF